MRIWTKQDWLNEVMDCLVPERQSDHPDLATVREGLSKLTRSQLAAMENLLCSLRESWDDTRSGPIAFRVSDPDEERE